MRATTFYVLRWRRCHEVTEVVTHAGKSVIPSCLCPLAFHLFPCLYGR